MEDRVRIYNYSPTTKEFLPAPRPVYARVDKKDPSNIPVPLHATLFKPPVTDVNEIATFDGEDTVGNGNLWRRQVDFRGETYQTPEGTTEVVKEIGETVPSFSEEIYVQKFKDRIFGEKLRELKDLKDKYQYMIPFAYGGEVYNNNYLELFSCALLCLGLSGDSPIPTYTGTEQAGHWYDIGSESKAFTVDEFKALILTYSTMQMENMTNYMRLKNELEDFMHDEEMTQEDYAIDLAEGWSSISAM